MTDIFKPSLTFASSVEKSRIALQIEDLALHHQLGGPYHHYERRAA